MKIILDREQLAVTHAYVVAAHRAVDARRAFERAKRTLSNTSREAGNILRDAFHAGWQFLVDESGEALTADEQKALAQIQEMARKASVQDGHLCPEDRELLDRPKYFVSYDFAAHRESAPDLTKLSEDEQANTVIEELFNTSPSYGS